MTWSETLNADNFFLRERLAEGSADRVALRLDQASMTYAEVDALASGYARTLADHGVKRGDRVLIVLPDGPQFVGALFGIFRMGAVVVMLNPDLTSEATGAIIGTSRPAVVVVSEDRADGIQEAASTWKPEMLVVGSGFALPRVEVETVPTAPEEPAMWLFSGGTTGVPKAVPQSHRSLVNTTKLYGQGTLGLVPGDITIAVPKLYFGYATGSNLLFPFSVGASTVLFEEPSTPLALFDRIERHRPTVMINVPSAINQMVNHDGARSRDLSSLRIATSAGEALPDTLFHRWVETFGVELLDGLGTAEMWHIFVSNRPGAARPGTVGQVVPGFELKACDEDGVEVPAGEVGRLWVKGDSLGVGYWEDPDLTGTAFRPPWFVGGDLISIDEEGFVTHRGRADDATKVKGKWFRPQELESVLLDHPQVGECAVVTLDDDAGLARPVAFVVRSGEVGEQDLIDWSLANLEAYKHPRQVYFVERLPLTHLGKVDRGALRRSAQPT